jgi:hypothetical protein
MDKERRKRLASLPFAEKIKIVERMRDRNRVIAASGLRKKRPLKQLSEESKQAGKILENIFPDSPDDKSGVR